MPRRTPSRHGDRRGDIVVVPGGEAVKNQHDYVEHMLRDLSARRIDRQSFAIAIGGGAVLDAVGFAAAIFHRGVRHVRCPTTVLAQDDSGVGVKNGVNAFGYKNLLGTFAPPFAVINDSAFLDMLPEREKRGGMAEAVKVALIRDADFFRWLEREADALARFEPNALDTPGAALRASCTCARSRTAAIRSRPDRPPARLRPLVGAQARGADPPCAAPRRGGGDRHRARRALLGAGGPARRQGEDARVLTLLAAARLHAVGRCARAARREPAPPRARRARRLPGASRRRADRHAARRRSAAASRSTPWTTR